MKIIISSVRGHLSIISLLENDPESCSDHFGGVESDFDGFLLVLRRFLRFCDFSGTMGFAETSRVASRLPSHPPGLSGPPWRGLTYSVNNNTLFFATIFAISLFSGRMGFAATSHRASRLPGPPPLPQASLTLWVWLNLFRQHYDFNLWCFV